MSFDITLTNVLVTIMYVIPGFLLCKAKKASADHLSTVSAILIYIGTPCMVISTFMNIEFSWAQMQNMGLFFVATLFLQAAFMAVLYGVLRKKYEISKYRLLTIASVMGNVGFFGLPIVRALIPGNPEAQAYSIIYVVTMNILVFTMGAYCLTKETKYMSLKAAIINPTILSFLVALPLHMLGLRSAVSDTLFNNVELVGKLTTPVCMFVLGIRLATVSLKKLFARPFVYVMCVLKMVVFPLFCYAAVYFLPVSYAFKASILILSATPCASVIQMMSEMYKGDAELSANCVLMSTLLCFITIPLVTLVL